jgi:HSP20 family protein
MTEVVKPEPREIVKEPGTLLRGAFPALPHWMERLDELFTERWPLVPLFRFPEELAPKAPPVDVYEEGGAIVVKAELPGMKREEIELHVTGDVVTISGRKEREEKVERKDYVRFERSSGEFTRSVKLPAEVEVAKVAATYKDGVLEIRAPKAEPAKVTARKVEVA